MQVLQRQINEERYDMKGVYQAATKLLFWKEESPLPSSDDLHKLVENFNDIFINKVRNIMTVLQENQAEVNSSEDLEFQNSLQA